MSVRVHKIVGYGLVDVESTDHDLTDNRFNPNGFFRVDGESQDQWSRQGFIEFLSGHPKVIAKDSWRENVDTLPLELSINWSPHYSLIHQKEFGLPNVVCIVPPRHCKYFIRFDNTIDYTEETECHRQENRYHIFRDGIYPYTSIFMDDRSGERLPLGEACEFVRNWNLLLSHTTGCKNALINEIDLSDLKEEMNRNAIELGFDHYEHALKHIYPAVPEEVLLLVEYCEVFTDLSTAWKLRPMLYVYWS